jgi:uncharacterized membrane protein YfhO
VEVVEAGPGRLILRVAPATDGLLVVSQPFYAGWQAYVDGERVPLYRVDTLLQGVAVASGSHQVELAFRPSPWPGLLSLVALVCCVAGLLVRRRVR